MATTRTAAKKSAGKTAAKSPARRFRALVERGEGSVCAIQIDFDVEQAFGRRGRVPVRGTLNGAPFRGSLFPMGGCHFMVVNRHLRAAAGVSGGETVPVLMERDDEPRTIEAPAEGLLRVEGDVDGADLAALFALDERAEALDGRLARRLLLRTRLRRRLLRRHKILLSRGVRR